MNYLDIENLSKSETLAGLQMAKEKKAEFTDKICRSLGQRDLFHKLAIGNGVASVLGAIIVLICTLLISTSAALLFTVPAITVLLSLVCNMQHSNEKAKIANFRKCRNNLDTEIEELTEHLNNLNQLEADNKAVKSNAKVVNATTKVNEDVNVLERGE